ncbi:MAG: hypothetical protein DRG31_05540 [Deltaproteobacteria bacterium]|nr:MAG: hypothetical protein DRG31_05540 [Deltaproteobacteria bacterium]
MRVLLPQHPWGSRRELLLEFPDHWVVEVGEIAGAGQSPLGDRDIEKALREPIGSPPLKELARGRREVVILFDDMSRITPARVVIPWILQELEVAGVAEDRVRFIAALGCHGAMTRSDFVKKLGEEVVSRFPVYNHNPFGESVFVGETKSGTRVFVNAEVMGCDLKIAIGSVAPHTMTGFGGGGKIVLPGVASFETIEEFHKKGKEALGGRGGPFSVLELLRGNPLREDIRDAVQMVGLDFKVELLVNGRGEAVAIFAGSPDLAHKAALREAIRHYRAPFIGDASIVVANVFSKASEGEIGVVSSLPSLTPRGGDMVLVCQVPEGHVTHYLMGTFGRLSKTPLALKIPLPKRLRQLIILTQYPEPAFCDYFDDPERIVFVKGWQEVLSLLKDRHPPGSKVAVYPSADLHFFG